MTPTPDAEAVAALAGLTPAVVVEDAREPWEPVVDDEGNQSLACRTCGSPKDMDVYAKFRAIVVSTSRMGLCSQTHHERLMREALAALTATEPGGEGDGDGR